MSDAVVIALIAAAPPTLAAVGAIIVAVLNNRTMRKHDQWERERAELNGENLPSEHE